MADPSDWPTYLVEHYWPGVTETAFRHSARRVAASADRLARAGEPIRFLHSTPVPDDEAAFCVLKAASPDLVERAYVAAGVNFERLVEAIESEVGASRPSPISMRAWSQFRPSRSRARAQRCRQTASKSTRRADRAFRTWPTGSTKSTGRRRRATPGVRNVDFRFTR